MNRRGFFGTVLGGLAASLLPARKPLPPFVVDPNFISICPWRTGPLRGWTDNFIAGNAVGKTQMIADSVIMDFESKLQAMRAPASSPIRAL